LQYINSQAKLNQKNSKWVEFLQSYLFVLKHGYGKLNRAENALSRGIMLLNTLSMEFFSLECMKELYAEETYFSYAWKVCKEPWSIDRTPYLDFHL
jgi:hypothetical protein